ncbi:MarR family transcriptional regulator [Bacillaceae bacterium SAOS 7]|nr:MarR family transcriptional regulator [Bacillaceae bacterium SAOS 7]
MGMDDKQMKSVEAIMREMLEVQQKSKRFIELISADEPFSQNQLVLLLQLKLSGGMKATEIAEFFEVTPGAVTSMCDKLEKIGLIERVRESSDRRVVQMMLTDSGEDKVTELFTKFPEEKLAEMGKVLSKVNQLMGRIF